MLDIESLPTVYEGSSMEEAGEAVRASLREVSGKELESATLGFEIDEDKLMESLTQLEQLLVAEGFEEFIPTDQNEHQTEINKRSELC